MVRLSELLELVFRDDIRNGISHADYILWDDGLRLRKRNGGYAEAISFADLELAVSFAMGFFQILREYNSASVVSFNPPKTIVGKFSANFSMPWTVYYDPETGAFGIKGSSPGKQETEESTRRERINEQLGGKVFAAFIRQETDHTKLLEAHLQTAGFEPNVVILDEAAMEELVTKIDAQNDWDSRIPTDVRDQLTVAT